MNEHIYNCPECKRRGERIDWLTEYTDKLQSEIAHLKRLCEENGVKL